MKAGSYRFVLVNKGTLVNELYLLDSGGNMIVEEEFIQPGASGGFTRTVTAGSYFLACKPGMGSTQLKASLTVS